MNDLPPISAPLGPIFTLTIPQSEPNGPVHLKIFWMLFVNIELLSPCGTLLLITIASSSDLNFNTYKIGTKSSSLTIGAVGSISTIVGST